MQKYLYCLLFAALFTVGEFSSNERKINCIDSKLKADIGNEGYTQCHSRNQALPIPKIKQCVTDWLKSKNIVITANNGQMTVDATAFATKANELREKPTGRAMEACKNRENNDRMYQEAARATQCIFEEVRKTCR
ncbi:uncharacterized protein LOC129957383 [Argiope bruennichi]|uniref:Uncharacterized protein n=1 Tax=Argiope bruennichi TaxID=94029 RepID=A0A8T0G0K8_ARGBR|nr:uncharacterized protein LOC129957383 [Argiope bruennichi]KAF8794703.1 hypothetical protein HNY73_002652 [Argiope bruennichi]